MSASLAEQCVGVCCKWDVVVQHGMQGTPLSGKWSMCVCCSAKWDLDHAHKSVVGLEVDGTCCSLWQVLLQGSTLVMSLASVLV